MQDAFYVWWEAYRAKHPRGSREKAAAAGWRFCYRHAERCAKAVALKQVLNDLETAVKQRIRVEAKP